MYAGYAFILTDGTALDEIEVAAGSQERVVRS